MPDPTPDPHLPPPDGPLILAYDHLLHVAAVKTLHAIPEAPPPHWDTILIIPWDGLPEFIQQCTDFHQECDPIAQRTQAYIRQGEPPDLAWAHARLQNAADKHGAGP